MRKGHSLQFRKDALKLAAELGSFSETCRRLGIHPETLRNWRKQLDPDWIPERPKPKENLVIASNINRELPFMGMAEVILTKGKENAH